MGGALPLFIVPTDWASPGCNLEEESVKSRRSDGMSERYEPPASPTPTRRNGAVSFPAPFLFCALLPRQILPRSACRAGVLPRMSGRGRGAVAHHTEPRLASRPPRRPGNRIRTRPALSPAAGPAPAPAHRGESVRSRGGAGPVRGGRRDAEQGGGGADSDRDSDRVRVLTRMRAMVPSLIVPSRASRPGARAAPTRQPPPDQPGRRPCTSVSCGGFSAAVRFERGTAPARSAAAAAATPDRRRQRPAPRFGGGAIAHLAERRLASRRPRRPAPATAPVPAPRSARPPAPYQQRRRLRGGPA